MNHVMANGLQRLYLKKGSLGWHLNGFSDVRASFFPGIFNYIKKEMRTGGNNGISGSHD
jgi:hypothetical protein